MAVRMCRVASCKREAATFCYHCQQDVCYTHFAEHSSMMMTDVHSLADQINTLTDNMMAFSMDQIRKNLFDQLQQWRDINIKHIEQIYKQKQIELNEKISQFNKTLDVLKVGKQQEISQIKEKMTQLIDAGEATFDQVNRLRELVNNLALDIDKFRIPTIRIETQTTNLDTCHIIDVSAVRDTKTLISDIDINDDNRQYNRSADHFHPLINQSMATKGNSEPTLSDPDFDPRMSPYRIYVPKPMQFPTPPYPPPPLFPVRPPMFVTESSAHRPSGPMNQEPSRFIAPTYPLLPPRPPYPPPYLFSPRPPMFATESSMYHPSGSMEEEPSHFIGPQYSRLPSTPPPNWSPHFLDMNQYPNYSRQSSSESEN